MRWRSLMQSECWGQGVKQQPTVVLFISLHGLGVTQEWRCCLREVGMAGLCVVRALKTADGIWGCPHLPPEQREFEFSFSEPFGKTFAREHWALIFFLLKLFFWFSTFHTSVSNYFSGLHLPLIQPERTGSSSVIFVLVASCCFPGHGWAPCISHPPKHWWLLAPENLWL